MGLWTWLKGSQRQARRELVKKTRDALDHGFTMHQIVEWAYGEVYFEDQIPAKRVVLRLEERVEGKYPYKKYNEKIYESQKEAEDRQRQTRYSFLKEVLLGKEYHPALDGRDITKAMVRSGVEPVQGHDCETYSVELLEKELQEQDA